MPDQPPININRAERRTRGRPKGSQTVFQHQAARQDSPAVQRQRESLNQTASQSPVTGISSEFSGTDVPPDYSESEQPTPAAFTGYRGKFGAVKTNIVTSYATVGMMLGGPQSPDGVLFIASAENIADAWIAWGKTDPRYMRVVTILWGGPFMTLIIAHTPLAAGIMANHNIQPSFLKFLNPANIAMFKNPGGAGVNTMPSPTPAPVGYQPVGANAPTDNDASYGEPLRVYPDEGIPADVDVQLRQLATTMHIPYAQVRDQYLLETAQDRIAQNQRVTPPGALGVPVTQPGK
jgi:hypothetical protein